MDHWQDRFRNRPLSRGLFLSVRWARMTELWASYCVRQAFTRIRFLCVLEVDFDRIDLEQRPRYQALADAPLLLRPPQQQRCPVRMVRSEPPALGWEQGIWV